MNWLTTIKDKKIVVLGAGLTGLSCLRFLHAQGLSFVVNDSRTAPMSDEQLSHYKTTHPNAELVFGEWALDLIADADLVVASPGIDLNKEGISAVISADAQLIGDIELFCLVNNSRVNPMNILAVTGSNGKSTVVSLLAYLGKVLGANVALAGNIGEPILDLLQLESATDTEHSIQPDTVILELSSFQLETLKSMKAIAASMLNLSDDHIDRHLSLSNYQAIKQGIYPQAQVAVINRDDAATMTLVKDQKIMSFGLDRPEGYDFGIQEDAGETWLVQGEQALISLNKLPLAGMHNALNYMAALALGYCAGWSLTAMVENLSGFSGLAHRCQRIDSADGVQWINDSKATNVGATIAALAGLAPTISKGKKLILIAGGDGKGADFSELKPLFEQHVAHLITLGKDGNEIADLSNNAIPVNSIQDAVSKAKELTSEGDMVLLSPACASIDMFKNFMIRGEQFIAAVLERRSLCH